MTWPQCLVATWFLWKTVMVFWRTVSPRHREKALKLARDAESWTPDEDEKKLAVASATDRKSVV